MSKLNELIQKLCPDGVQYRKLAECCTLEKGNTPIQKAVPGEYPLVVTTEERKSCNSYQFEKPTVCIPLISSRGHGVASLNSLFYQEGKFALGNILCGVTPINSDELSAKFLFYYLNHKKDALIVPLMRGGANVSLTVDSLKRVKIPVPPISVQNEIARIFDKFDSLEATLLAELAARKKQYEYYRDKLLNLDASTRQMRLGDICSLITKGTTPKSYAKTGVNFIKTEAFDGTKINPEKLSYVDDETHTTFLKRSILEENDILITIAGATIGKCAMVPKEILPANTNQALAIIRLAKGNSPKYVMYLLQSDLMKQYMQKNIKGSAQPNLSLKQLNDFVIPLPSLSVQEHLVSVLDHFEDICSDFNIGLPAEIAVRQKQYAYYRDKLLTFKQLS